MRRRDELSESARFGHNRRDLASGHGQPGDLVRSELVRVDRLDNDNALEEAAIEQRHAEKGSQRLFAGLLEVAETRV